MSALIKLVDLYKTYHTGEVETPVLKGVSLEVGRGEMVALMGSSGSGKSTLMNILGCLDRPSSGEYWLDDQEVSQLANDERAMIRNKKIGFVFQSFNLLARTSSLENVIMPLTYTAANLTRAECVARGKKWLERVGLGHRLDNHPSQLSGGQQQRVAIARSLVNNPPLLFADEPTGNLDSRTSKEMLQLFQELNAEEGITVILVTHDAGVASYARRTIKIHDGLIVEGAFTDKDVIVPEANGAVKADVLIGTK
jgi:putative ABC transport system ATP-binding protein